MEKSLTLKEHQILEKFESKLKLKKIQTQSFSIFQRNKNFTMASPSVYKIEETDSYLIFGDFLAYDLERIKQQLELMQQMQKEKTPEEGNTDEMNTEEGKTEEIPMDKQIEAVEMDNEKKVGLNMGKSMLREEAIELIMDQSGVSRVKAISVLTECDFDILRATEMLEKKK